MSTRIKNHINGRLSLREPQSESLARLIKALEAAPEMLEHGQNVAAILDTLKAEFPSLADFEREFPSLCFALATGVGKTRLMGAFIAYLHLAHGINNFFVLAPNLTIYDKLIADFTRNTPKYVFKGIAEFAQQPPLIITGDNYDQTGAAVEDTPFGFAHEVRINIFNISKINSEVRGGKEPRIKRMREVLGESYFNHLANLPDLVLLMDESHRYRAKAGMRAINELNPLFGLELTATPFAESGRGQTWFQNIVMHYPLASAIEDGYVKEPAVVTQRNFDASAYSAAELEKIKLEDGVRLHESTKVELLTYARENGVKVVKPFMLVIARDTTHAAELLALLESSAFYEGRYAGKVIQVDSSQSGKKEDEMIARLLAVESVDEPTEIVIHVNMLKEGWDVTNLYTIVPLRAANARTLIEQSIGRGLRLPYGKRTGVAEVDRLNIVAHDKFQDIIDEANRGDSPIRLKTIELDADGAAEKKASVTVSSGVWGRLGLSEGVRAQTVQGEMSLPVSEDSHPTPVFKTEAEKRAARMVMDVVGQYETRHEQVPTSTALLNKDVQQTIAADVSRRLTAEAAGPSGNLLEGADGNEAPLDVVSIVAQTMQTLVERTIDIPRITVVPKGEVTTRFEPFELDVSGLNLQPGKREIVGQELRTNEQFVMTAEQVLTEQRPEDYIVHKLIDYDDVDYFTQSAFLYELAGQMVAHLRSYLSEDEAIQVLNRDRGLIAREIHAQMMAHFKEEAAGYEVQVSRGFTQLKACNYTTGGRKVHSFRDTVTDVGRIKQMLFGGFKKCLYDVQKFDSDTERRFAVILERDVLKWFKPAKGQFQMYYKLGGEQPEYVPDFVIETERGLYLAETKRRDDVESAEVQAKAEAAIQWCRHASEYAANVGSKSWTYLLIPHDEVEESKQFADYVARCKMDVTDP